MTERYWLPRIIWLLLLLVPALPLQAETVHLSSGESVKGRIVRADDQMVSLESDQGFGTLQIPREEIVLIEFDDARPDLSRRVGIGYLHRTAIFGISAEAAEYAIDALSFKYWLSGEDSVDVNVGFYSASVRDTTVLEVFSFDLRYAQVFRRDANLDLYYGASAGILNVKDQTGTNDIDDNGNTFRVFLGSELFFSTLPNLGISGEIGLGAQTVGDRRTTNLSTTTFPTLSVRYYY